MGPRPRREPRSVLVLKVDQEGKVHLSPRSQSPYLAFSVLISCLTQELLENVAFMDVLTLVLLFY